jgi:CRISPR-associated protein Cas1
LKKLLNTLFVTTDGSYIQKEGESVVVKVERQVKLRLPIHNLNGIVCFGRIMCSPALLGFCAQRGVAVSYLSSNGRFLARVQGLTSGNVLLRREQYRRADSLEQSANIAKAFVLGKLPDFPATGVARPSANCQCLSRSIGYPASFRVD